MNAEEVEKVRVLWKTSEMSSRKEILRDLAEIMISPTQFSRLKSELQKEYFNPSEIISEILTL